MYVTNGFVDEEGDQGPGQLTVLLGKGGSSFQSPISYPVQPNAVGVTSFAIGDLNGDHKLDIAIGATYFADDGGFIVTFLGNGDGTFQAGPTTTLGVQPVAIALADLNGDGKLDLAAVLSNQFAPGVPFGTSVAVALGNGDGHFRKALLCTGLWRVYRHRRHESTVFQISSPLAPSCSETARDPTRPGRTMISRGRAP